MQDQVDGVVFGAGRGVGLQCVKHMLQNGLKVRAVVRSPDKYADTFPQDKNLSVVSGDVTDVASLKSVLQRAKGAIFAASASSYWAGAAVDFRGVSNVAQAAGPDQPIVLVSSALVTPKNRFSPIRLILNNIKWGLMDNKYKGECALRDSGKHYTIVRPGQLTNDAGGQHKLVTGQRDVMKTGSVSRADVAAVCVAAITTQAADGLTFELKTDKGAEAGDVSAVFEGLQQNTYC